MAGEGQARQSWREYFRRTIGGNNAELEAAVDAAFDALRRGADKRAAAAAGMNAISGMRSSRSARPASAAPRPPSEPPWSDFMLPGTDDIAEWERLQEQKQIANERVRWRVMRKTPMGRLGIAFTIIVSILVVGVFGVLAYFFITNPPGSQPQFGPEQIGQVTVPDVRGADLSGATRTLQDAGLMQLQPQQVTDTSVAPFTVLETDPAAGAIVNSDITITIRFAFPG